MVDAIHIHPHGGTMQACAQRLVCWSGGVNNDRDIFVRTDKSLPYFAVRARVCGRGYGPLRLKPDGPIIPCTPGQLVNVHVYPGDVKPIDTATCRDSARLTWERAADEYADWEAFATAFGTWQDTQGA